VCTSALTWLNDAPDTHPSYEDRAYGGAGIDVLIGNTGGDRLIDWVGEFNSYIVPFAPFGIATVSRQVEPFLPEFLYALSFSEGVDPTRDSDQNSSAELRARNGELFGEIGLVLQQDHGYWQQQTGGPTDPQAGNIPGGRRDVLRGADFNNGSLQGFAVDSGVWAATGGTLQVAAASLGLDAAAVFYADVYLPVYYEIAAAMSTQKPTAGWKSNSYIMFDYWSPTDFKFAGIDISTNKMVIGHRDASGWHVDAQAPFTGSLKEDTTYQTLVAVNGTVVMVSVNSSQAFSYTFGTRLVNGEAVGLNKGLIGFGSDNSRGVLDNIAVQALPPQVTLDSTEYFEDGVADQFTGPGTGAWTASGGRYVANGYAVATLDLGASIDATSYNEIDATIGTSGVGGVVFDGYAANDYKFVALDVAGQQVLVGHVDPRRGWMVDASYAKALSAGTDHIINLALQGTVVTVTVNGSVVASYAYNSAVADGDLGVLSRTGATSADRVRVRTNDDAFTGFVAQPEVRVGDAVVTEGSSGTTTVTIGVSLSKALVSTTTVGWRTVNGTAAAGSDFIGVSSGTVTFAAGGTSATIQVSVVGDAVYEPNETFSVELTSWAGLNLADKSGLVTLTNDDKPAVSIQSAASVTEGNSGSKTVALTVTLSGPWSSTVTVSYATANGTAAAPSDYAAKSGTLTFAAGVTSQTIVITVNGDNTKEANETFKVTLNSPVNATLGSATGTVTIVNDDGAPLLAAATAPSGSSPADLTPAELEAVMAEAKAAWLAADPTADFSSLAVTIGELEGRMLGVTGVDAVTIDPTAAGWGWTLSGGAMDLRTVLLHELGHALGLDHDAGGLMAETLSPGIAQSIGSASVSVSASAAVSAASAAVRKVAAPATWIRPAWSSVIRPQVEHPQRAPALKPHLQRARAVSQSQLRPSARAGDGLLARGNRIF
jgi:Calx-beta domain/Matrixin